MDYINELKKTVIDNGYCIGCGACSFASKGLFEVKKNSNGLLEAIVSNNQLGQIDYNVTSVCPFYNKDYNEDVIGKEYYMNIDNIKHNNYIGYNLINYAGYVRQGDFRRKGSSGGFGTWIASKLLEEGMVDKIIHVKSSSNSDLLFEYKISSNLKETQEGSKSRYYPVEMSKVLDYVVNNDYNYLFVGVPCFIKAIRQLQNQYPILKERIKYTLGLACGHLKSDFFAKSMAWELGIHPNDLEQIDFRVKNEEKFANNYSIKVSGKFNGEKVSIESLTKELFVSNWGHGLFKYKACDYCDDVLAETADVTIGDAWLPEYSKDFLGTNIVTIRSESINNLFIKYKDEIHIDKITSEQVFQSQAGGFRHRREGLSYRLYLLDNSGLWRPLKRVNPDSRISRNRKKIYEKRIELAEKSFVAYKNAIENNDFGTMPKKLRTLILEYDKIYRGNGLIYFAKRVFRKLRLILKSIKRSISK